MKFQKSIKNRRFFITHFLSKKLTLKSLLNLHFNGFGAISPLRGCRSCFSVHFGPGDVQKAPTATCFKPILMFFTIFLRWRVAAGAFFWPKLAFLWEKPFSSSWRLAAGAFFFAPKYCFLGKKTIFLQLAACRRRLFLAQNEFFDQNHFPPAGPLPQALFFSVKNNILGEKSNFLGSKHVFLV